MRIYIKIFLISFLSSILIILTLPPFNISICAWVAQVPVLYLILSKEHFSIRLVLLGFVITGIVSVFYGFSWILAYQKRIFFIVWPLCSLIFPLFGLISYILFVRTKNIFLRALLISSIWIVLLKLFSLTYLGYHWGEGHLAYSQNNIYLIQLVSVVGTMGLSFLILLCNAAICLVFVHRSLKSVAVLFFAIVLILISSVYGRSQFNYKERDEKDIESLKVALVQPGLSGEPGFEHVTPIYNENQFLTCMKRRHKLPEFIILNKEASLKNPQLIIWPQYNLPIDITQRSRTIQKFYVDFRIPILLGTFIYKGTKLANISVLLDPYGKVEGMRTAVVPPPFRMMNQAFGKDFKPIVFKPVNVYSKFKIGSLLCYEDTSGESARKIVRNGAQILVVQTNDEVFQETILPKLHLKRDVFRAVENRRWLIRAATTGISAVINSKGEIVEKIPLKEKQMIFADVSFLSKNTFFNKYGNYFWIISFIIILLVLLKIILKKKS